MLCALCKQLALPVLNNNNNNNDDDDHDNNNNDNDNDNNNDNDNDNDNDNNDNNNDNNDDDDDNNNNDDDDDDDNDNDNNDNNNDNDNNSNNNTNNSNESSQLQHLMQTVEQELHVAEAFAADLGVDIRHLVENLMTGQLTSDQYLDSLPPLTERAHRLLSNFRTHVQHELQSLQGHKRQLDVLSTVSGVVQGLETQGQALFGQVTDALKALTNPQNLLTLAGQLAQRVTH
nr:hypothetical protein BaRGS_019776 [Batillaria attramentaria]